MNPEEKEVKKTVSTNEDLSLAKQLVFCYFCERKINEMTKIFCQECKDIFICVKCFVEGKERDKHKKTHPYRILNKLDFKLFKENWMAREELILLDGLQQYGYGNWKSIGQHLGGDKTMVDCEKHFHQIYLDKPEELKNYVGKNNIETEGRYFNEIESSDLYNEILEELDDQINDFERIEKTKNGIYGEILGYAPLREEFEVEYDNEAELFLADMEFSQEDSKEEIQIKENILEIYNR